MLRGESCASAARHRSSTDAGWASAAGSSALVSSSAIPIRVCASGSRSVLRRAANSFFNHGVWRSDAYSASKRSTLLAGCTAVSSGPCRLRLSSSRRIVGGIKLLPSRSSRPCRSKTPCAGLGTKTVQDDNGTPMAAARSISLCAASAQKLAPGGMVWRVIGMQAAGKS